MSHKRLLSLCSYLKGCLQSGTRGDSVSAQSSQPAAARSFKCPCSLLWKPFTVFSSTKSAGNKLYTAINPKADRRTSSGKVPFLGSSNCLSWFFPALRVKYLCCFSPANQKKALKCEGPLPSTVLCTTPSIAMSRLARRGAKLNSISASTSLHPSALKKRDCTASKGFNTESVAWYNAAVRYST